MTLHKLTDYHGDDRLLADMLALLASSYEKMGPFALKGVTKPVAGMKHELYILRDEGGELAAFCTVGYHQVATTWCGYVGLTAVREDSKGKALGVRLWKALYADCLHKEALLGKRIPLYFTTASPLVFDFFAHTLEEPAPSATGQCGTEGNRLLNQLAALQYPQAAWDAATPHVLRRAAPDVRYSPLEHQRVVERMNRRPDSFFNSVGLDERHGDRLLVVGYAPNTPSSALAQ